MANNGEDQTESLLSYPCDFTLKIFGNDSKQFEQAVIDIIHKEVPDLEDQAIQRRSSKNGNYLALSVTIRATSKEQLDRIYQALSDSKDIIMVI